MNRERSVLPLDALSQLEHVARALIETVQMLKGNGLSVPTGPLSLPATSATFGAVDRHAAPFLSVTDVANQFLLAKARAGRSDNYLAQCVKHLRSLDKFTDGKPIQTITTADVEAWLYQNTWSARTRLGHLLTARTLFTFAMQRLYVVGNPALAVDKPLVEDVPPMIHTPAQVRAVLEANLEADPSACRCLAIRYFGGLRTSEAVKLDEREILHEQHVIEVTAAKAKTRKRRLVTIQPALALWLLATQKRGGALPLPQANNRLREAVKRAGMPWGKSVTRHTFCSYHLAKFRNAGDTALEAGHEEQILFANYRAVVTKQLSEEFWSIWPKRTL